MNTALKNNLALYVFGPLIVIMGLLAMWFFIYKADDFSKDKVMLNGKEIVFTHTDDNKGENLIIKSDRKEYHGLAKSDVYFSITNQQSHDELIDLIIHFDEGGGDVNSIARYDKQTDSWLPIEQDSPIVQAKPSIWSKVINFLTFNRAKPKVLPANLVTRQQNQTALKAKETNYYKMAIAYSPFSQGEFWIEAKGKQGGYGLLDPWYSSSWTYRKKITVDADKVMTDATNFPMLATTTLDTAKVRSDGYDIIFTDSANALLDFERESYNNSTGELVAWIETNLSSTTDTILYMYYGNSSQASDLATTTGVWDSNYKGVWHLNEGDSTAANFYEDSTSNANHGQMTDADGDTVQANGQIGKAMDFNGDADYVTVGTLDLTGDFTLSFWGKSDEATLAGGAQRHGFGSETANGDFRQGRSNDSYYSYSAKATITILTAVSAWTSWHHYYLVVDAGSVATNYRDGQFVASDSSVGALTVSSLVTIAKRDNVQLWNGIIDEARISNIVRSAQWIETEYNNQASPGTFMTFDVEQGQRGKSTINTSLRNFMTSGLVGHWTFDGPDVDFSTNTAYDRSGNANNGAITNMSTSTSPAGGMVGQALDFDGVNDYIWIPDGFTNTLKNDNTFTISMWVKIDAFDTLGPVLLHGEDTDFFLQITPDDDALNPNEIYFGVGGTYAEYDESPAIQLGEWYHIVWIKTGPGNSGKVYQNGVELSLDPGDEGSLSNTPNTNSDLRFGNAASGGSWDHNGQIDEVRIYNYALSATEIQDLYNAGAKKLKTNANVTQYKTGGLVGHWTFNGADMDWGSNTAYDRSGQGNNGAITNMATSSSPVAGMVGQALNFDGSNDHIKKTSPSFGTNSSGTFAAWIKPDGFGSTQYVGSMFKDTSNFMSLARLSTSANLCIWHEVAGAADLVCGDSTLTTDWTHIAVVSNGSVWSLYVNGEAEGLTVSSGTNSGDWFDDLSSEILYINSRASLDYFFSGLIDEARIYNYALSATEIQDLYNASKRRYMIRN